MSMGTQTQDVEDVNGPEPDLKRVMGPKLLLLFIVGDILGAGVYAVTGDDRGRGRRHRLAAVPGRLRRGHPDGVLLPRAGHEVPPGRRRRALRPQGVRHPLRHVPGRLRGRSAPASPAPRRPPTLLAPNLLAGLDGTAGSTEVPDRDHADRLVALGFMVLLAADQPARRRGEREVQRRAHPGRDDRPRHRDRGRLLGDGLRRRRPRPGHRLRVARTTGVCSSRSPLRPRSRSSPWWASRTRSTWSRRPRSPSASSRGRCSPGSASLCFIYMLVAVAVVTGAPARRDRRALDERDSPSCSRS